MRPLLAMQPTVTLNQASPVQNQWYTLLDLTGKFKIYQTKVKIKVADETVQIKMTVDGIELHGEAALTFEPEPPTDDSKEYYCMLTGNDGSVFQAMGADLEVWIENLERLNSDICEPLYARSSIKIEFRKTTNNGNGNLQAAVSYGQYN